MPRKSVEEILNAAIKKHAPGARVEVNDELTQKDDVARTIAIMKAMIEGRLKPAQAQAQERTDQKRKKSSGTGLSL